MSRTDPGAKMSRAQRRRVERLTEDVDKVTEADARFFERFVGRSHRFRLASAAEIAVNDTISAGQADAPPGRRWYVAVKKIGPGVRLRVFTVGNPGVDTDATEEEAKAVYDALARPGTQSFKLEQSYRAAIARRDADRR